MATVRAEGSDAARAKPRAIGRRDWGGFLMRPATAAAAGALLVAGALGGYLLHQPGGDDASRFAAVPTRPSSTASGTLERHGGSAILHVERMPTLARNEVYEAWVERDGDIRPSSLFTLRRNRSGDAAIPGPLEGADAVLVTAEPRGGSSQPTSRPVLQAKIG
jgi:hypothetical protein